jgi:hypothetical protein
MAKAMETPLAPLAELTRQNMELWARMQASMLAAFNPAGATPTRTGPPAGATGSPGEHSPDEAPPEDAPPPKTP